MLINHKIARPDTRQRLKARLLKGRARTSPGTTPATALTDPKGVSLLRQDPSRTGKLRDEFSAEMARRLDALAAAVGQYVTHYQPPPVTHNTNPNHDEKGRFASGPGLKLEIHALRTDIAKAAQEEYDAWQPDGEEGDPELGSGGICDRVADRVAEHLGSLDGVVVREGGHEGDDHAWVIVQRGNEAFGVDIHPSVYEEGGGFSWKKTPGVTIRPEDVDVWPVEPEHDPTDNAAAQFSQNSAPPPVIEQLTGVTCGPASLLSVLKHFACADSMTEPNVATDLGTTGDGGTPPAAIVREARAHGLQAREVHGREALAAALGQGYLAICPIQTPGGGNTPDTVRLPDGHYVVAYECDVDGVYVMDPAGGAYAAHPWETWEAAWHDVDVDGARYDSYAIVLGPRGGVVGNSTAAEIDAAAAQADPTPSEAQRKAGNYAKGHVTVQGIPITIETAKGIRRKPHHERPVAAHYGYFKRTESEADGDHVDVFVGPEPDAPTAYVVDQVKGGGSFDEHKVMLGFPTKEAAAQAYKYSYPPGWAGMGAVTALPVEDLKDWLANGDTGTPFAEQVTNSVPGTAAALAQFRDWLDAQTTRLLLSPEVYALCGKYAGAASVQGAGRGYDDANRKAMTTLMSPVAQRVYDPRDGRAVTVAVPTGNATPQEYAAAKAQALKHPVHREAIKVLAGRTFEEIKGMSTDARAKMGRIMADGVARGRTPNQLAYDLRRQIDLSKNRSRAITHTEIVRAHAEGQLNALAQAGVRTVEPTVEWMAGEGACPECLGMAGNVYTIDEARGLIPAHPFCRCAWSRSGKPSSVRGTPDDEPDEPADEDAAEEYLDELDEGDDGEDVYNFNPNHDEKGRFASGGAGGALVHKYGALHARLVREEQRAYDKVKDVDHRMTAKYGADTDARDFSREDFDEWAAASMGHTEAAAKSAQAKYAWEDIKSMGYTKDTVQDMEPHHLDSLKQDLATRFGHFSGPEDDRLTSLANDVLDYYDYDPAVHNFGGQARDERGRFAGGAAAPKFGALHAELESKVAGVMRHRDELVKRANSEHGYEMVKWPQPLLAKVNELYAEAGHQQDKVNAARAVWGTLKDHGYDKDNIQDITLDHLDKAKTEAEYHMGAGDETDSLVNDALDRYDYHPSTHNAAAVADVAPGEPVNEDTAFALGLPPLGNAQPPLGAPVLHAINYEAASPYPDATLEDILPYVSDEPELVLHGGKGSGNYGHAGRPGQVGGSGPGVDYVGSAKVVSQSERALRWQKTHRGKLPPGDVSHPSERPKYRDKPKLPKPDWHGPPPPSGSKGKGVDRKKGNDSQTLLGDWGEHLSTFLEGGQARFRSILPGGKRSFSAAQVKQWGSSIDLEWDHTGDLYELKVCSTNATQYKLKAKLAEKEAKEQFAANVKGRPITMIGVHDVKARVMHFYVPRPGMAAPGKLYGGNVKEHSFNYLGSVKYTAGEWRTFLHQRAKGAGKK